MVGTLGGNLVVGQSGGCTAVINSSLAGVVEQAMQHAEIHGILGAPGGIEGVLGEQFFDLAREGAATLGGLRGTPSAALGSCRYKLKAADYRRVLEVFDAYNVRYFIYIGGNDSADTAHRVAKLAEESGYELRVIGVPKTIDNDLQFTDHCPGYGSAARFVAIATMDAGLDTEAMRQVDPVKVVEVMGRNAGWLAAASSLGKNSDAEAPHLIYVPERPLVLQRLLADVEGVYRRLGYCVIVATETIRDESGKPIGNVEDDVYTDSFGHRRLVGVGRFICESISRQLGLKARWDKPGTLQRVSTLCVSPVDEMEAYDLGRRAVQYALRGHTDQMVVLRRETDEPYRCSIDLAPLEKIANAEKHLPADYLNDAGNFVSDSFLSYARPLIGGPLPRHARLARFPASRASKD
ncbi:MAG: 6-phosphofructokinase [Chloroflexi bacterium]|nr:6-phosphofructokinase [Chloroflexota bacterium]